MNEKVNVIVIPFLLSLCLYGFTERILVSGHTKVQVVSINIGFGIKIYYAIIIVLSESAIQMKSNTRG